MENNNICLYLHDRKDIEDVMKIIRHAIDCSKKIINNNFESFKNSNMEKTEHIYEENNYKKDNYVSGIYQKIQSILRK